MPAVALGSLRSCGVTTTALALACTWPEDRSVLLVECDPAGGTLAAALGLPPEPGLVSLAAAARRPLPINTVLDHAQVLAGGGSVLIAPPSADQARSALSHLGGLLGALGDLDCDVLVDCGRLDPSSLASAVFTKATRRLLISRPSLPDLHTAATSLERIIDPFASPGSFDLILIGAGAYPTEEIAAALSTEVLASLPHDRETAQRITQGTIWRGALSRAPLVRAARSLAAEIVDRLSSDEQAEHLEFKRVALDGAR